MQYHAKEYLLQLVHLFRGAAQRRQAVGGELDAVKSLYSAHQRLNNHDDDGDDDDGDDDDDVDDGDDNDDDDDYAHLYLSLIALPWMQDCSHIDCPVSFTNIVNQALGF